GAELGEARDRAAGLDAPGRGPDDLRDDPEQRRLTGAVPPDEADRLARLDGQRNVAQRLHFARAAAAARDEEILQRALRLRVDAKGARHAVDDDPAARHATTGLRASRTIRSSTF